MQYLLVYVECETCKPTKNIGALQYCITCNGTGWTAQMMNVDHLAKKIAEEIIKQKGN